MQIKLNFEYKRRKHEQQLQASLEMNRAANAFPRITIWRMKPVRKICNTQIKISSNHVGSHSGRLIF